MIRESIVFIIYILAVILSCLAFPFVWLIMKVEGWIHD